jgi:uncharacterized protein YdeI (YjbR/CyaY-like superfamily)
MLARLMTLPEDRSANARRDPGDEEIRGAHVAVERLRLAFFEVMTPAESPQLLVADAKAWRRWLGQHHDQPAGVWLVLAKKGTQTPTALTYDEALEEALCFGWIDGQVKRRDDATYLERFTPRRPRSRWSQRNVDMVSRLLGEGRMHPAGIAEAERARLDGRWADAYPGQAAADVPADLAAALAESPRAGAMFSILSAQNRYAVIHRITATGRPDTRSARVQKFVHMLARGETIHPQKRMLGASTAAKDKKTISKLPKSTHGAGKMGL